MQRTDDLVALSMPTLERLRELTGETASLHCLLGNERICVAELVSPEPIRMQSDVGRTYPIHAGAAGKAILAWQPDVLDRLGLRLGKVAPATITDAAKLRARAGADPPARLRRERVGDRAPAPRRSRCPCSAGRAECSPPINVAGPAMRWNRAKRAQFRDAVVAEVAALTALTTASSPNRVGAGR